ncbi:hypothetical protein [Mesorhizobium sp. AA22]|uniref:hypothetical protein n=1 Tax=Mesorhizobium sp. AA22 TaxID=1854057 RepID=UPI0007EE17E5|nr:hypothetical protein [Mesorhizobium sp. AA22]
MSKKLFKEQYDLGKKLEKAMKENAKTDHSGEQKCQQEALKENTSRLPYFIASFSKMGMCGDQTRPLTI